MAVVSGENVSATTAKKRLFRLIAIVIALIVTVAVGVLAFQMLTREDTSGATNEFVGTWSGGMFDGESYGTDKTWVFYTNNSLKEEDTFGITWYEYYTEEDNSLCKKDPLMCYTYEFTNDGNTLSLSLDDLPIYRFNRVQES